MNNFPPEFYQQQEQMILTTLENADRNYDLCHIQTREALRVGAALEGLEYARRMQGKCLTCDRWAVVGRGSG